MQLASCPGSPPHPAHTGSKNQRIEINAFSVSVSFVCGVRGKPGNRVITHSSELGTEPIHPMATVSLSLSLHRTSVCSTRSSQRRSSAPDSSAPSMAVSGSHVLLETCA